MYSQHFIKTSNVGFEIKHYFFSRIFRSFYSFSMNKHDFLFDFWIKLDDPGKHFLSVYMWWVFTHFFLLTIIHNLCCSYFYIFEWKYIFSYLSYLFRSTISRWYISYPQLLQRIPSYFSKALSDSTSTSTILDVQDPFFLHPYQRLLLFIYDCCFLSGYEVASHKGLALHFSSD